MFRKRLMVAALLGVLMIACAPAVGPEDPTLKLAVLPIVDALPIYIAERQGYFSDAGIKIEFVPVAAGTVGLSEISGCGSTRPLSVRVSARFDPAVLTSLRLSVGTAVAVLYITETTATFLGLGYYIFYTSSTLFDYAATYAGAVAMGLLGLIFYFFIDWLERRLCPWKFVA